MSSAAMDLKEVRRAAPDTKTSFSETYMSMAQWASMRKLGSDIKEYMRHYKSRHTNDVEEGVGKVD